MKKQSRIYYLDSLRVIAIVAVALMHVVCGTEKINFSGSTAIFQPEVYSFLSNFTMFAVPVFFMISGALMLNPEKKISTRLLLKKYVRRLFLALIIFGLLFALCENFFDYKTLNIDVILQSVLDVYTGDSWVHLWFLYSLIGIYLLLPLFKPFIKSIENNSKTLLYVLVVMFIFISILPYINEITGNKTEFVLPLAGSSILFYFLGWYIYNQKKTKQLKSIYILMFVVTTLILLVASFLRIDVFRSYYSPITVLLAVSIFGIFANSKNSKTFCSKLTPYIFGVYLMHTIPINFFYKFLHISCLDFGGYILIPLFLIGSLLFGFIATWVLRLIPFFKKYVL